jgi:hypothetical protein
MSNTRRYAWTLLVYLPINLIVMRLLDLPITWWFVLVFITLVSLGIFARLERKHRHRDGLKWLTEHIELERWAWQQLEKEWIGRAERLKEDIRNSNEPENLQVYVQAGTVGKIVGLNRDERAPFYIWFPGFAHKVVVRLEKLDLYPTGDMPKELDAA